VWNSQPPNKQEIRVLRKQNIAIWKVNDILTSDRLNWGKMRIERYAGTLERFFIKSPKRSRKEFFLYFAKKIFYLCMKQVLDEIIFRDGVFVVANHRAYIFAYSDPRAEHHAFIGVFLNPYYFRGRRKIIVELKGKYRKIFKQEVLSGHKYRDYQTITKELIYGIEKRKLEQSIRVARNRMGTTG